MVFEKSCSTFERFCGLASMFPDPKNTAVWFTASDDDALVQNRPREAKFGGNDGREGPTSESIGIGIFGKAEWGSHQVSHKYSTIEGFKRFYGEVIVVKTEMC
jgi:hypothetical protein